MAININGRSWSIADFRNKAHTQPKSPDGASTPAFPDGIFGDFLQVVSTTLAACESASAAVASASTLLASLTNVAPVWSTYTSASPTMATGSRRAFFDTSGGPFKVTQQGSPTNLETVEFKTDTNAETNNVTFVFNGTAIVDGVECVTVILDVADDHARYQYLSGKWREVA